MMRDATPLLAGLLALALAGPAVAQRHPKYPRWHAALEPARQEALRTGRPLFVVLRCEP
jgi:hypothetical protein